MSYKPNKNRYAEMRYNRCGKSGVKLPLISLGLWHNFGNYDDFNMASKILRHAFDSGITHFDLANNYGPPAGAAELNVGKMLKKDFKGYRDEMIISTKAGYLMWDGPYGEWGSRKYLIASLDQSLKRMGLDYVDIFYSHRFDPGTPLEETMGALDHIVKQGKALYVGISNYGPGQTQKAVSILNEMGTACLINQPKYSMFHREPEEGLLDTIQKTGIGCIPFSPLAQGLLTNKYLNGIPEGSRVAKNHGFLKKEHLTQGNIDKAKKLDLIARNRNQTLAQMAIAWLLKDKRITSVLIGASSVNQLNDNLGSLNSLDFSEEELQKINQILKE